MLNLTQILIITLGALLASATAAPLHPVHHDQEAAAGRGLARMFHALQGQVAAARENGPPGLWVQGRAVVKRRLLPAWMMSAELLSEVEEDEEDRGKSDDGSTASSFSSSPSPSFLCHTTEVTGPCFRPLIKPGPTQTTENVNVEDDLVQI